MRQHACRWKPKLACMYLYVPLREGPLARPRGSSGVVQIHPGTKVLFVPTDLSRAESSHAYFSIFNIGHVVDAAPGV